MTFTDFIRWGFVFLTALVVGLACAVDDVIISINPTGDSLQFSVPWDSVEELVDTIVVDGDTIILVVVDTVIQPPETILVPIIDTVFRSDTVVETSIDTVEVIDTVFQVVTDTVFDLITGDTIFVESVDTVIQSVEVITSTTDSIIVTDTVIVTITDTIIQLDILYIDRTDTVIEVDTVVIVDTVITSPPSLDFGVESLQLEVGQSTPVTVTVTNALGFPIPSEALTWLSGDSWIASVSGEGIVTGVSEGVTNVIALDPAEGLSANLPVVVQDPNPPQPPDPPPGGFCANAPDGYTLLTDRPFNDTTFTGWSPVYSNSSIYGYMEVGDFDSTSPRNSGVAQATYENNFPSGRSAGAISYLAIGGENAQQSLYICTAFRFSPNWIEAPNNINKLMFWTTGTGGNPGVLIADSGEPAPPGKFFLQITSQGLGSDSRVFNPNVSDTTYHSWGDWVEVELQVERGPIPADSTGVTRYWVDGTLAAEYTDVVWLPNSEAGFRNFKIEPTWDTGGSTLNGLSSPMWLRFDYVLGAGVPAGN